MDKRDGSVRVEGFRIRRATLQERNEPRDLYKEILELKRAIADQEVELYEVEKNLSGLKEELSKTETEYAALGGDLSDRA